MEPASITIAIVALVVSAFTAFTRKMKRCKASRCCEVEMRDVELEDDNDVVNEIRDILSTDAEFVKPDLLRKRSFSAPADFILDDENVHSTSV